MLIDTCTATLPDVTCIPTQIVADVFFTGDDPVGFADILRQALLMWPFNITGLLGIGNLEVTEGPTNRETPIPTPSPSRASGTIDGITGGEDRSIDGGNSVNPGAFVAAGLAALVLVIVGLFVIRRRRQSDDVMSKHRELQNDDEGGMTTDDDDTLQNVTVASPPRKSYIVGENDSLQSWNSRKAKDGQEVFIASTQFQHSPHHECSSPNCEACEIKRQQGTRFVLADSSSDHNEYMMSQSTRNYEQNDTVDL